MLRSKSTTFSLTPGIVENLCFTPEILTDVTAAPGIDVKRTLLKALPMVWPKPVSKGSITNSP